MELSDYDLLGISSKATFRVVKNAYYELSRIYHPDSTKIIIGMSKEDRQVAFQRIQKAYENIKSKMNVIEVDLPKTDIKYKVDYTIQKDKINIIYTNNKDFNEKFNKEFEKINILENIDNPYSIHYKVPTELNDIQQDSQIILKESESNKCINTFELGVNYIEDHSCEKYYDFNKLQTIDENKEIQSIKETVDNNLNKKLEKLINERNQIINLTESEIDFIERQKSIKKKIDESRQKVENKRNQRLLI